MNNYPGNDSVQDVSCVRFEESEKGRALIVSFSAATPAEVDGGYAFLNVMSPVAAEKLFLVDPFEALYTKGIPGVGNDFWEISRYIKEVRDRRKSSRVLTIGHSAGGFAALVTGAILGADLIHVFNPPTSLASEKLFRDKRLFRRSQIVGGRNREVSDLAEFLSVHMPRTTCAFVHYSALNSIDRKRSLLLDDLPNIHLVKYPFWEHNLARYLARSGAITQILQNSVHGSEEDVREVLRRNQSRGLVELPLNTSRWLSKRVMNWMTKFMGNATSNKSRA